MASSVSVRGTIPYNMTRMYSILIESIPHRIFVFINENVICAFQAVELTKVHLVSHTYNTRILFIYVVTSVLLIFLVLCVVFILSLFFCCCCLNSTACAQ